MNQSHDDAASPAATTGLGSGSPSTSDDTTDPVASDARPSVAKPYRLQFEDAQNAWVLLYPEGMVKLNQSAGEILSRCDGERCVSDVVSMLEAAFDQQGLDGDVKGFLSVALQQKWIQLA